MSRAPNFDLSLNTRGLRCLCGARPPLDLLHDGGYLILGRFCPRCDMVVDVRARFEDWLAVHQLVTALLDHAQHSFP